MSDATLVPADLESEIIHALRRSEFPVGTGSRNEGIMELDRLGFPRTGNEEYRFTPITRVLEKNFSPSDFVTPTPSTDSALDHYLIPSFDGHLIVFVNGQFSEQHSKIAPNHGQLTIQSLTDALSSPHGIAAQYFTKLVKPSEDAFAALNTACWQGGVFIHVAKNSTISQPVFILHFHDASRQAVVAPTRVVAIIEENSELSIVEKFNSTGTHPVFSSVVEEIAVKENSTLHYHKIQNDPGAIHHVSNTRIHQATGSRLNTFTLTLDGQLIRNNLGIIVDGERCESHLQGLYLLHNNTLADNHTVVDHQRPNSYSNELYKGVMDASAKGVFNGKIFVRPQAQKTNAFQSNRNILLSDNATIHTKPQLEIWADDVKCSHGCTSGQLDEEALFYLRTRGISKHIARAMVLYAFACEILEPIRHPALKTYLNDLISERLQKDL